jgi:hypothetical protein
LVKAINKYWIKTSATLDKALGLYPSPNVPGSPFVDSYDRAWTIMQDIIMGCMSVFGLAYGCARN